jgi:thiamine monophosphate synthase
MAVCTWRYGAAGAIEVADRRGGRFRPAEGDAVRLISRHEIDCVVVIGSPTAEVAQAIERAGTGIAVVRIAADAADVRRHLDAIHGAGEAGS